MNSISFKPVALALIATIFTGCSSVRSRTEMPPDDWTVYPGLRRDFSDMGDAFEGKIKGPDWSPAVVIPILIGDIPFSTVVDSAALPYDIYRVTQQNDQGIQP